MKPQIDEGDFYKFINQSISENNHANYLKEVIKKYEEYKKEFNKVFTNKALDGSIYQFRITYLLKKLVWRDIEILDSQTFLDLAEIIIYSMGWDNDHMHGFDIPESKRKSDPFFTGSSNSFFAPGWEDDPHPTFKTDEICISNIDYKKIPKLYFIFDYGDGHRFSIEFKKINKLNKKEKTSNFPRIIDQRGVGPEQYPCWEEI